MEFIKYQTRRGKINVNKFKNWLTSIMRLQQKDYYNQLLQNHRKLDIQSVNDMNKKMYTNKFPKLYRKEG